MNYCKITLKACLLLGLLAFCIIRTCGVKAKHEKPLNHAILRHEFDKTRGRTLQFSCPHRRRHGEGVQIAAKNQKLGV